MSESHTACSLWFTMPMPVFQCTLIVLPPCVFGEADVQRLMQIADEMAEKAKGQHPPLLLAGAAAGQQRHVARVALDADEGTVDRRAGGNQVDARRALGDVDVVILVGILERVPARLVSPGTPVLKREETTIIQVSGLTPRAIVERVFDLRSVGADGATRAPCPPVSAARARFGR